MAQVATSARVNVAAVAKDIRAVARACESRYAYRYATIRIVGAARAAVRDGDLVALRICLAWVLDQQPGDLRTGYRAAARLTDLYPLLNRHRVEIARALDASQKESRSCL